jgi:N-acetylglucosaminyldiphosphoundecaprenol N-acetyl-beta-D-mannosaminyltransferase
MKFFLTRDKDSGSLFGMKMFYEKKIFWKNRIQERLFLEEQPITTLYTVNFELLGLAMQAPKYADILKLGIWVTVDGFAVTVLLFLRHFTIVRRLCGSDLIFDLFETCEKCEKKMALIGGKPEILSQATKNMLEVYPSLSLVAMSPDFPTPLNIKENKELEKFIIETRPEVLAVCFGSPKQEYWIAENKEFLEKNGVKIVAGLGGTVDFLAKALPRAPKLFRMFGAEWVWRCCFEPFRLKRYAKASYTILKFTIKKIFSHRKTT